MRRSNGNKGKEYMSRKEVITKCSPPTTESRVNVVFICAVVLPFMWLFFVMCLGFGG
jgi:hypothetical protein